MEDRNRGLAHRHQVSPVRHITSRKGSGSGRDWQWKLEVGLHVLHGPLAQFFIRDRGHRL